MIIFSACQQNGDNKQEPVADSVNVAKSNGFNYVAEQFADLRILRYKVPGFEELSLKQKELIYYLSEAARYGRDILFDQNYKYNLVIRHTLEEIYKKYSGDRNTEEFKQFVVYLKRVWFSNGIHHHYSTEKFVPDFSREYFRVLIENTKEANFPLLKDESIEDLISKLTPVIFDTAIDSKRVVQDQGVDIVSESAVNFYEGVTQQEVEDYYNKLRDNNNPHPVSLGINTKVVKEDGVVREKVWKLNGMYSAAIEKIIYWLEKALPVAEDESQKQSISKLIEYYKTGDLVTWDDYNVAWVNDLTAQVDFVNGFIENYGDPLGMKSTWESVVNFKNIEATKRTKIISDNAQWFEDHSPIDDKFKKKEVKGVTAKVITVAQLGGDCYPSTPIGINLPNADWIRKEHGSKSVTMENITDAYDEASKTGGFMEEFAYSPEEIERQKKYGALAGNLHTDLHECLGHGSGLLLPGVSSDALANYSSALEESRADLFALYYMLDPKMTELGLMPTLEVAKAEYDSYISNGIMWQLKRVKLGSNIEQAHMRCRALIANWVYEKGFADSVIVKEMRDGKTFITIRDYEKLRSLFGELLSDIQRIKSEGDFKAGQELVEKYAVKVDQKLHEEMLGRFEKLNLAPYSGFLNPDFEVIMAGDTISDIKVIYPDDFTDQMLDYSEKYSVLPFMN